MKTMAAKLIKSLLKSDWLCREKMIKLNSKPLNLELRGYLKKNQRWLDLE
jgi:hypothetical protein